MPSKYEKPFRLTTGSDALVADRGSTVAVIVTHPWGLLGGNMHNNVVSAAVLFFQRLGLTTARFNFAGSQLGRGYAQVEEVHHVARCLLDGAWTDPAAPPRHILLIGYSYGSLIASSACAGIPECIGVVSIAPPFAVQHWLLMFNAAYHLEQAVSRPALPRLLVIGSEDNFTSERAFRDHIQTSFPSQSTTGAVVKGADHFFGGRERDLMHVIGQWLMVVFPQCQGDWQKLRRMRVGLEEPTSSTLD